MSTILQIVCLIDSQSSSRLVGGNRISLQNSFAADGYKVGTWDTWSLLATVSEFCCCVARILVCCDCLLISPDDHMINQL